MLKKKLLSKIFLRREINWFCLKVYLNAFGKRFRRKLAIGHTCSVEPLRRKVLPLKARKIMLFAAEMLSNDDTNPKTNHRLPSRRLTCEFDKKKTISWTF